MRLLSGVSSALDRRLLIILGIVMASLQTQPAMSQFMDESSELMCGPGLPTVDHGFAGDLDGYGESMWSLPHSYASSDDDETAMFSYAPQQYMKSASRVAADRQAAKTRKLAQKAARIAKNKARAQAKGNAKNIAQSKVPVKSPLD